MSDLRTVTKDIHDAAERTAFSVMLIQGDLTREEWATFLYNQLEAYQAIEARGLITQRELLRVPKIQLDIEQLGAEPAARVVDATWRYVDRIKKMPEDLLWSHIYVRYLGDLYGGQMIKKNITWSTNLLDFEERSACVAYLRQHTAAADHSEAIAAFKWVIDIYDQMHRDLRPAS
jgi:heme oxygenase